MLAAYLAGLVEALAGRGERANTNMRRTARVVQNFAPTFPAFSNEWAKWKTMLLKEAQH
jgi:hypothetical protein